MDEVLDSLSEGELLEWRRVHCWVGRIQEVRAATAEDVYIRVFWLYWPDELPGGGRERYHGRQEVILSNHVDIVSSNVISSKVDVERWDEYNDEAAPVGELYYRQILDLNKTGRRGRAGLGKVRKHCVCGKPHHPDEVMVSWFPKRFRFSSPLTFHLFAVRGTDSEKTKPVPMLLQWLLHLEPQEMSRRQAARPARNAPQRRHARGGARQAR